MASKNCKEDDDDSDCATTLVLDDQGDVVEVARPRAAGELRMIRPSRIQITRNVLAEPPPSPRRSNRVPKPVDRYSPSDDN